MNITEIPFVALAGIGRDESGRLRLAATQAVANHLGTLHAGAQFLLAETASGDHLQTVFAELVDQVVPVLRASSVKFRRPAQRALYAIPSMTDADKGAFLAQFSRKGRASITVSVELADEEGAVTFSGSYEWFVQRLPGSAARTRG